MRPDRIEKEESVLIDVLASRDAELQDTHLSGRTVDISEMGMKVSMTISVPESSKLGLRLEMDQHLFRLEGQVRWTMNDGEPTLGILLDKDSADYEQWAKLFVLDFGEE